MTVAHVTYTEAVEILEKHNDAFEYKVSWGCVRPESGAKSIDILKGKSIGFRVQLAADGKVCGLSEFGFLVLNDGTFFETLQVVYGDGLANFEEIRRVNVAICCHNCC